MNRRHLSFALLALAIGLPLSLLAGRALQLRAGVVEIHGRVAEDGGWSPEDLTVEAGQPLSLRLISDDVVHGFAVGQHAAAPIDLEPGRPVETTLTFLQPGRYVFYCTRWCGQGHWRMRGTIQVTGAADEELPAPEPLYVRLGLEIDAPHPAEPAPEERPSAGRGALVAAAVPAGTLDGFDLRAHSPAQVLTRLRLSPGAASIGDQELWDLVAYMWRDATPDSSLQNGQSLYAANCAACHGETGAGDGVMGASLPKASHGGMGMSEADLAPANFRDPRRMLGASAALLQGKIIRGGMGTGMPYWGPIFTEAQTWELVDYLWSLSMDYEEVP
jgi:mono/diheme cytochrome c family protein/plastocyanin